MFVPSYGSVWFGPEESGFPTLVVEAEEEDISGFPVCSEGGYGTGEEEGVRGTGP